MLERSMFCNRIAWAYGIVLYVRVLDDLGTYLGTVQIVLARRVAEVIRTLLRAVEFTQNLWKLEVKNSSDCRMNYWTRTFLDLHACREKYEHS